MVGNEGRTRIAIYDYFNKAGFNPDRTCSSQTAPKTMPSSARLVPGRTNACKFWKADTLRSPVTDDQMCTVPDAPAAPNPARAVHLAVFPGRMPETGRQNTMRMERGRISEAQLAEKERVYAPVGKAEDPKAIVAGRALAGSQSRHAADLGDNKSVSLCNREQMIGSIKNTKCS